MKEHGAISVRICGIGGQGIVQAGNLLAEALLKRHPYATNSASYGPEVRGASVRSDVIAAERWIAYPRAERPDFAVALGQKVYNESAPAFGEETVVLHDPVLVKPSEKCRARHVALKVSEACTAKFGDASDANLAMLGALAAMGVADAEALEEAAIARFHDEKKAREAVELGVALAQQA